MVGRALAPVGRTENELGSVATALDRAFDRLEDAFERQGRFTPDASRELRTSLTTFVAHLDWALARRRSDGEYQHSLRVVELTKTR